MKHLISALIALLITLNASSQIKEQTCHFGITFEISNNPSWGYGEPVVLTVEPNSPAAAAGIQPGDIIMEINRAATYLRDYATINSWLFDDRYESASFTIRNLNSYFKEYELPRRCRSVKSLDESTLASSFSFYSLEDVQERMFTLPLKLTGNSDVDYSDYHTFNFIEETDAPAIDTYINNQLEKVLVARGLVRTANDPDILIQTYYSYQTNPKFNPSRVNKTSSSTWRFDAKNEKMVLLPILSGDNPNAGEEGQFVLELGVRFFDQKFIDPKAPTQIWDVNVKEYLTSQYTLEEYARLHLPLIMMQFPYFADKNIAKYYVGFSKYNYTGLCYDMDNMKVITDVDRNSPAYNAGLRPGMTIERINKEKFIHSKDEVLNGYKRFIIETMKYRDPSTRFIDANKYPDCMYWNKKDYGEVAKILNKDVYAPSFKYLYGFNKYISDKADRAIIVETRNKVYSVTPEVRKSVVVRAL